MKEHVDFIAGLFIRIQEWYTTKTNDIVKNCWKCLVLDTIQTNRQWLILKDWSSSSSLWERFNGNDSDFQSRLIFSQFGCYFFGNPQYFLHFTYNDVKGDSRNYRLEVVMTTIWYSTEFWTSYSMKMCYAIFFWKPLSTL